MNTHADKTQENKSQSVANVVYQKEIGGESTFQFVDNRPEAIAQRKLQVMANNSPQVQKTVQLQAMADNYSAQEQQPIQKKENNTGLPDNLKSGIEKLSGYSMDDVEVHYSSDKPAQLQAHAYAQGTDIHITSGQENHLRHEAWHVVQQKQGRVKPTMQMKGGVNVNDDVGLEKEADMMGDKALQILKTHEQVISPSPISSTASTSGDLPVQRIRIRLDHGVDNIMNNVRASPIPEPGTVMQDGFRDYQANHASIGHNENIVLEGHGTYLEPNHDEGADYDSQAYLTPQQLANVAFLVPKGENWEGQIILFGCNTGPLTMEVSRHYLALSGRSVNVIGTLADIRMEVPDSQHPDGHARPTHTAEYDQGGNQAFPMAPGGNISARGRVRAWLTEGLVAAGLARDSIKAFYDIEDDVLANNDGRNNLREEIRPFAERFNNILDAHLNYQGLTYGGRDDSLRQILMIREVMITAVEELLIFEEMLRDNDNLAELQDKAVMFNEFFDHLSSELRVLARMLELAKESYPAGTVDWEGENVINSRAEDAGDLEGDQLDREEIDSDRWGGGGQMLMLEQVLIQNDGDGFDDFL